MGPVNDGELLSMLVPNHAVSRPMKKTETERERGKDVAIVESEHHIMEPEKCLYWWGAHKRNSNFSEFLPRN